MLLTSGSPPNDRGCRRCGKIGHIFKNCPNPGTNAAAKKKRQTKAAESSAPGPNQVNKKKDNKGLLKEKGMSKIVNACPPKTEFRDVEFGVLLEILKSMLDDQKRVDMMKIGYRIFTANWFLGVVWNEPFTLFIPDVLLENKEPLICVKVAERRFNETDDSYIRGLFNHKNFLEAYLVEMSVFVCTRSPTKPDTDVPVGAIAPPPDASINRKQKKEKKMEGKREKKKLEKSKKKNERRKSPQEQLLQDRDDLLQLLEFETSVNSSTQAQAAKKKKKASKAKKNQFGCDKSSANSLSDLMTKLDVSEPQIRAEMLGSDASLVQPNASAATAAGSVKPKKKKNRSNRNTSSAGNDDKTSENPINSANDAKAPPMESVSDANQGKNESASGAIPRRRVVRKPISERDVVNI